MDKADELYERHLNEFVLSHVTDGDVLSFYLHDPETDSRMGTCFLTFNPEGIAIQGDWAPGRHGVCSAYGYGPNWFGREQSLSYLCSKFLTKTFVKEEALQALRNDDSVLYNPISDRAKPGDLQELADKLEQGYIGEREYYEALVEEYGYEPEGCPGYTYDPGEAGMLGAIQRRFAELYPDYKQRHDLEFTGMNNPERLRCTEEESS